MTEQVGVTEPAIWKSGPLADAEEMTAKLQPAKQKNAPAGESNVIPASNPSTHSEAIEKSE